MNTFASSYLVTNRQYVDGSYGASPQPAGALTWLSAPAPGGGIEYQEAASAYTVVAGGNTTGTAVPAAFAEALLADLQGTVDANQRAHLTVFIHGLDTDWAGAASDLALAGNGLRALPGIGKLPPAAASGGSTSSAALPQPWYSGLVIGFSWPDVEIDPLEAVHTFHDNRLNANASTASLANLLAALQGLAVNFSGGLTLNLLAHSEGTYLTQQTAGSLPQGAAACIGQIVLLAADLDTTALGAYPDQTACGQGLSQAAAQVTAYWSLHDNVLGLVGNLAAYELTRAWGSCVRDGTVGRLGKSGPPSDQTLYANAISLDCSAIVVGAHLHDGEDTHVAYLYIPQVLQDIAQVLSGQAPTQRSGSGSRQKLA